MGIKLGMQLWNQVYPWTEALAAARRVESLGYDSLWTWEHAYACMGDPLQDTFDAYTLLAAWSQATSDVELGVLVGANRRVSLHIQIKTREVSAVQWRVGYSPATRS